SIFEDSAHGLWFTGFNGSLSHYSQGKFSIHKQITDYVRANYPSDWVGFCEFDADHIYFSLTKGQLLFSWNKKTGEIHRMRETETLQNGNLFQLGSSKYVINFAFKPFTTMYERISKLWKCNESLYMYAKSNKVYYFE